MRKPTRSTEVFAMVPVWVLTSPAVTTLPHYAKVLLFVYAAMYRGKNNGDLAVTWKMARHFGINSKGQLNSGTILLTERGLIIKTRQGGMKPLGPSLYALAWRTIDDLGPKIEVGPTLIPPRNRLDAWNNSAVEAQRKKINGTSQGLVTAPSEVPQDAISTPPEVQTEASNGTPEGVPSRSRGGASDFGQAKGTH